MRADSGFCREELMAWCEREGVDCVLGLARNEGLVETSWYFMGVAQCAFAASMHSERAYGELEYRTLSSWSRSRRVAVRAEHSRHGDNPRFVVTSLAPDELDAKALYEDLYCARGDTENRIEEQQLGLEGPQLERTQCGTICLRLLKIGAQVRVSVRRIRLARAECWTTRREPRVRRDREGGSIEEPDVIQDSRSTSEGSVERFADRSHVRQARVGCAKHPEPASASAW